MKKLKSLPSGMSYTQVRARQIEKERAEREAVSPAQVKKDEAAKPDKIADPKEARSSEASTEAETKEPVKAEATETPDEVEAAPASTDDDSVPANAPPDRIDGIAEEAAEHESQNPSKTPPVKERGEVRPAGNAVLKGYVARPATGVSGTYDKVAGAYGDKAALSYLVDVSVAALGTDLDKVDPAEMSAEPGYSGMAKKTQFKRSLPRMVYDAIVRDLDPLNIMKPGTIGTIIIQGAVNRYIENEKTPAG